MRENSLPTKTVFEGIQSLRAVAAISVVLLHLTSIEKKYGLGTSMMPEIFHYGGIGVDIFFVISGFIMAMITKNLFRTSCAYRFLIKRFIRIFPMYWLYSLLVFGIFLFKPELVNNSQANQANIVKSFLLLPDKSLPLLMVGWSLIYEIYFYFIVAAALRYIKEGRYPFFLTAWFFSVIILWWAIAEFLLPKENPWLNLIASPLCLEFIAGNFIALVYHRITPIHGVIFLGLGLTGLWFATIYMISESIPYIPGGWLSTGIIGIPAFLLVLGAAASEQKLKLFTPNWLSEIGNASYSLYLSHILVISALGRIWLLLPFGHSGIGHIVSLAIIFLAAISWSIIGYKFIENPLINWLNNRNYYFFWSRRTLPSRP